MIGLHLYLCKYPVGPGTMLSITRFKRLMTCYFVFILVCFVLYYASRVYVPQPQVQIDYNVGQPDDRQIYADVSRDSEDVNIPIEDPNRESLMVELDQELRKIASNSLSDNDAMELLQSLDESFDKVEEAVMEFGLPTHALGIEDVWPNATDSFMYEYEIPATSSTTTPDYVQLDRDYDAPSPSPPDMDIDYGEEQVPLNITDIDADMDAEQNLDAEELEKVEAYYVNNDEFYSLEEVEIPHIVHHTWATAHVPEETKDWLTTWSIHHPFWLHWFWTEAGFMDMMNREFPEYSVMYQTLENEVLRSDMRKYFLLYKEGGVAVDLSIELLKPLDDDLLIKSQCILARESDAVNALVYNNIFPDIVSPALMICRQNHPFFQFLIDNLKSFVESTKQGGTEKMEPRMAGTIFLSYTLFKYRQTVGELDSDDDVFVAPVEMFLSSFDRSLETQLRVKCNGYRLDASLNERQRAMCDTLTYQQFNVTSSEQSFTQRHSLNTDNSGLLPPSHTEYIAEIDRSITIFDS